MTMMWNNYAGLLLFSFIISKLVLQQIISPPHKWLKMSVESYQMSHMMIISSFYASREILVLRRWYLIKLHSELS